MRPLSITITLLFFTALSFGQQISRSTLTSAGDFSTNKKGISLSWTMGQSFCQTIQSTHHLTEGFQQGELSKNQLDTIENTSSHRLGFSSKQEKTAIELISFPNPTVNALSLRFEISTKQLATVLVSNSNGRMVLSQKVQMENGVDVQLNHIEKLSAGMYFVKVIKNGKIIATNSFVKVER